MNIIDFTQPGGFPFTQDTLSFMQSNYNSALNALASGYAQGSSYVILSGCAQSGSVISSGFCVVNGELLYCPGGSGSYVRIAEAADNATFVDGQVHLVYVSRMLIFQDGDGRIVWSDFVRIPKYPNTAWQPLAPGYSGATGNLYFCRRDNIVYIACNSCRSADDLGRWGHMPPGFMPDIAATFTGNTNMYDRGISFMTIGPSLQTESLKGEIKITKNLEFNGTFSYPVDVPYGWPI